MIVSASQARRNLTKLIELVYSRNIQVRIERRGKPVARLVGEPFMRAIGELAETHASLFDTLATGLGDEIRRTIEEDRKERERISIEGTRQ